jgi:hypothetical protein
MTTEREAVAAGIAEWVSVVSGWVAIPSVSVDPERHADVGASTDSLAESLRRSGFSDVEVVKSGPYRPNGRTPLPLLRKGCEAIAHVWRELAGSGRDGLVRTDG